MISRPTVERLEREAFRGPFLTVGALLLIIAGLAVVGLACYWWFDASETASRIYSSSLEARVTDPLALDQADLATRSEWLSILPYQGLALILAGFGLLLWRWVAAVRLRMTVSALILPSLRSADALRPPDPNPTQPKEQT